MSKLKIAIISLTCCEGCQMAALDLGERFLDLSEKVDIVEFHFLEETVEPKYFDVAFVEGTPITEENFKRLKEIRNKSKYIVALGACACLGGVQELKNYQDKNEKMRYVYKNIEAINNPDIKPLKEYIKVDFELPGCPMTKEEFLNFCQKLINNHEIEQTKLPERPVCYDCQLKRNICLLQENKLCFGPIILGGCGAPCPSASYPCDGCRGPFKDPNPANVNNLIKLMTENYTQEEIDTIIQRFGALNDVYPKPPKIKESNLPK